MKKNIKILFIFSLGLIIFSCASTNRIPGYARNAIQIYLKSSPDLNKYDNRSHTLLLCVYQLSDPNTFNQKIDEDEGISELLECSRFDASVTNTKRLIINPGQEISENLDRYEGTKYVGIVAGYYKAQKEKMTRFFQIRKNFITGKPKKLKIGLFLGAQDIQVIKGE